MTFFLFSSENLFKTVYCPQVPLCLPTHFQNLFLPHVENQINISEVVMLEVTSFLFPPAVPK